MVVGVIFAVAGVTTYVLVANELAAENIKVSDDAAYFAGLIRSSSVRRSRRSTSTRSSCIRIVSSPAPPGARTALVTL